MRDVTQRGSDQYYITLTVINDQILNIICAGFVCI